MEQLFTKTKTRQYKYIKEPTLKNLVQLRQNQSADAATTKQLNMIHLRSKHVGWKDHCSHIANPNSVNILGLPWRQRKNKRDKQHKPRCSRSQFVGLSSSRRCVTVKEQERSSLKMSRRNCRDYMNKNLDQHQDLDQSYDVWSSRLRQKISLGHYKIENRRQPSRQQPYSLVVRVRK